MLFRSIKLEAASIGRDPFVLRRFAVVDGREQSGSSISVPASLRTGAIYKVRTEAVANQFTTWISEKKVDEWNDARLNAGGVGLYSDRGEPSTVVGALNVYPLIKKK